jgi:lysyl-tRNA synthetase class 1
VSETLADPAQPDPTGRPDDISREELRALALNAKAWPFQEARKVLARIGHTTPEKGHVLFETGYGPSGLPHIGTFGEVARTTMVMRAFQAMSDVPTRLVCFSDDMDGLRKVPDNIPNQEAVRAHLGKPLTRIPDPFGTHESFGHHNNARLQGFLDYFGFDYEFVSATDCYTSGRFDDALLTVLRHYDDVMAVMLPTLGKERQQTYSPFLPVSPKSGRVLQVPVLERDPDAGTITFEDEDGARITQPVTGGRAKLQWKPDWAMRWFALDVDYEMSGKDLIDSARIGSQLVKVWGGRPPEGFHYELFLDDQGEKISKSKGNGLTVDAWLTYAPSDSLSLYMFQKPGSAKKLYFDVIPKAVDEYLTFLGKFDQQTPAERLENPVWHVHGGQPPASESGLSFSILLNLASATNTDDRNVLWGFITRYVPEASPETTPILDRLVGHAIRYYQDFVKPHKRYRAPTETEIAALQDLRQRLDALPATAEAEEIQTEVYEAGKAHGFAKLRDWFKALYEILLGQQQGPRMGSFIALYGLGEFKTLLDRALAGEDLSDG